LFIHQRGTILCGQNICVELFFFASTDIKILQSNKLSETVTLMPHTPPTEFQHPQGFLSLAKNVNIKDATLDLTVIYSTVRARAAAMFTRDRFLAAPVIVVVGILAVFVTGAWGIEQGVELQTTTGTLHGTLDLPSGTAAFPVVVIIAGSGPTDRDGNQPSIKNDSLKHLSHALAAKGIATLRYDKRGVGQSAAAAQKEEDLRFETYVDDVVQWVALLRHDSRFSGIGLVGHSEGSLIAMVAARQAKIDTLISLAGSGRAAPKLIREQLGNKLPPGLKARSDYILDELVAGRTVADVPNELASLFRPTVQPYMISWFKYDPVRELAALKIPVLIVQGTTDLQVTVDDAKRLAAANKDAKLRLVDGMNHVLKRAKTPAEQQAAYTDPSIPIEVRAVEEIIGFLK
jgi:pimeloyl-ACP methyl ester carboxylesterase